MNVWAAIDIRGGAAVQLVGGDPSAERVRAPDPAAVAGRWLDAGFRRLHVVDLDAALGDGRNDDAVAAIAAVVRERREATRADGDGAAAGSPARGPVLQVGGGLRDDHALARTLDLGVDRAVVGTRAIEDRAWLEAAADRHAGRLVVAADVRDGEVMTRGWRGLTGRPGPELVAGLGGLPLAGVLVTDVGREGRQGGVDVATYRPIVAATAHPVLAAGGITTRTDLDALADAGVAGAVLGMALYTGRLAPADALGVEDA